MLIIFYTLQVLRSQLASKSPTASWSNGITPSNVSVHLSSKPYPRNVNNSPRLSRSVKEEWLTCERGSVEMHRFRLRRNSVVWRKAQSRSQVNYTEVNLLSRDQKKEVAWSSRTRWTRRRPEDCNDLNELCKDKMSHTCQPTRLRHKTH